MTADEVQFVLKEGEGLFVEFKERPDKSLAREMVAFANASGGRIFIGVKDDASVSGIQIDNRLKSQIQDIARNCDPPEDFGKYSRTRNRLIASLLMRTEQAEKMGTGIRRIQQALKTAGQPPAEFDYDDYNFSITLLSSLRARQAGTLNGTLNGALNVPLNEKIIYLICENPGMQRKALAVSLDVTEKIVGRYLLELIAERRVEHRGSKKTGGYWAI